MAVKKYIIVGVLLIFSFVSGFLVSDLVFTGKFVEDVGDVLLFCTCPGSVGILAWFTLTHRIWRHQGMTRKFCFFL